MGSEELRSLAVADLADNDEVTVICRHQNIVAKIRVTSITAGGMYVNAENLDRPEDGVQYFSATGLLGTPIEPRIMLKTTRVEQDFPHLGRASDRHGCGCTLTSTAQKSTIARGSTNRLNWL
jgi:hypothetical protein